MYRAKGDDASGCASSDLGFLTKHLSCITTLFTFHLATFPTKFPIKKAHFIFVITSPSRADATSIARAGSALPYAASGTLLGGASRSSSVSESMSELKASSCRTRVAGRVALFPSSAREEEEEAGVEGDARW